MRGIKKSTLLIVINLMLISPCFTGVKTLSTEKKENSQSHNPILFLHGLGCNYGDWFTMRQWFKNDGWPNTTNSYAGYAYNFDDPHNCSVQANINNALKIKQWVEKILNETGAEKIDLIGHSMGGYSSRYYIKYLGGIDRVDDYVSLGTPHHGENSSFGDRGANDLVLLLNDGDETPGGILNDTLGIRQDPYFPIRKYNGTHIAGTINYTSIFSRNDTVTPYISCSLDGAHNIEVELNATGWTAHGLLVKDWSVYTHVRVAVDDLNSTFSDPTTTTSPTTNMTSTTTTPGLGPLSILFLMIIVVILRKGHKNI